MATPNLSMFLLLQYLALAAVRSSSSYVCCYDCPTNVFLLEQYRGANWSWERCNVNWQWQTAHCVKLSNAEMHAFKSWRTCFVKSSKRYCLISNRTEVFILSYKVHLHAISSFFKTPARKKANFSNSSKQFV